MKKILFLLLAVFLLAGLAAADIRLTQPQYFAPVEEEPSGTGIEIQQEPTQIYVAPTVTTTTFPSAEAGAPWATTTTTIPSFEAESPWVEPTTTTTVVYTPVTTQPQVFTPVPTTTTVVYTPVTTQPQVFTPATTTTTRVYTIATTTTTIYYDVPSTTYEPVEGELPTVLPEIGGEPGGIILLGGPPLTGGDYTMYPYAVSGGGGRLSGGNYRLFDIKCTPFVGTLTGNGYGMDVDGVGVFYPETEEVVVVEEGPVILTIERAGDDKGDPILITWTINTADFPNLNSSDPVDIYMLVGQGEGEYHPTQGWEKVVGNNGIQPGYSGDFDINAGARTLTYIGNVGAGARESYFKGLIATSNVSDQVYGLPGATAVGKMNIAVAGAGSSAYKYSFVSVPFAGGVSADEAFGKQLPAAASKAEATELWGWTGVTFGQQEFLHETDGWTPIGGFGDVRVKPTSGYVFKTKSGSSNRDITVVGKVLREFAPVNIGANLYSFMANPFLRNLAITTVNLNAGGGVYGGEGAGYADQLWGWTGDTFGDQAYYDTNTGWQPISGFQAINTLQPGRGLVYRRNGSAPAGGFNWGFTPVYP